MGRTTRVEAEKNTEPGRPQDVLRLEGRFEPSFDGWWFADQGRPLIHILLEWFGDLNGRFVVTVEKLGE